MVTGLRRCAVLMTVPLLVLGVLTTIAQAGVSVTAGTPTGPTITYTNSTTFRGGDGGTPHQVLCGLDSALTKLTLIIDGSTFADKGYGAGLEVYCTQVDAAGSVRLDSAPVLAGTVSSTNVTATSGRFSTSCPTGSVVTGDQGRAGTLIDAVQVNCTGLAGSILSGASSGASASSSQDQGGTAFGPDACPAGSFATGVDARSGQDLDGFSLRCGQLTTTFTVANLSVTTAGSCGGCSPPSYGPGARDVPVSAIPSYMLPATATDAVASAPLRSVPLRSVPLRSVPLRSVPLRSVPLASVLLSQIPLTGNTWQQVLARTSLASTPLETVTLDAALAALDAAGQPGPTLDQVDLTGTPLGNLSVASIFLGSSGIGSLPIPAPTTGSTDGSAYGNWCAWLSNLGYSCAALGLTGSSPVLAADLAGVPLRSVPLRSVPLRSVPVGAPLRSVPLRSVTIANSPLRSVPLSRLTLTVGGTDNALGAIPLTTLSPLSPTSTLGNIVLTATTVPAGLLTGCVAGDPACQNLGDALTSGHVSSTATLGLIKSLLGDQTLGDLGNALGSATLGDLADAIDPTYILTLGDALLALVPSSAVPWEQVALDPLQLSQYDSQNAPKITYAINMDLQGLSDTASGDAVLTLPAGFRYTGQNDLGSGETATVVGQDVHLHLANRVVPATHVVHLIVNPGLALGPFAVPALSLHLASVLHGAADAVNSETDGGVNVVDAVGANSSPSTGAVIAPDHLVLGHISAPGNIVYYRLPVPPAGTHVHVLLSHLASDDDLVVYGAPADPAAPTAAPLRSVPLRSVPLLDEGIGTAATGPAPTPQLLNDVPLRTDLALQGQSAHHGTADEEVGTLSTGGPGYLTIQVSGYNGAWSNSPYLLRVVEDNPVATTCPGLGLGAQSVTGSLPTGTAATRALLLVNTQQLAAENTPAAATALLAKLGSFAARADVAGLVVPVDADASTVGAYSAWNRDPCSTTAANDVVNAVNAIVRGYKVGSAPGLTSVTLVGADAQLPMYRTPDLTLSSNESGYAETDAPPAGGDNPLSAAQRHGDLLTDDAYGSLAPVGFLDRRLYLPDLAVGRLVETPAEITAQLDQFVTAGGALTPRSALTTGYDFLADGARAVDSALTRDVGTGPHSTLIDEPGSTGGWTRAQLNAALFPTGGTSPFLAGLNAHFDHNRALPSAGNISGSQSDLFTVGDITANPGRLAGRLLFSMGCHAGLNVPDRYVGGVGSTATPAAVAAAKDWAQTFANQNAIWVANTGFGLGDTSSVALSEELMRLLALRLDGSMSAGQALQYAKQAYFGSLGAYGVYDEKALEEAVYYGLPMWRVGGVRWDPSSTSNPPVPAPLVNPHAQVDPTAANATTKTVDGSGLKATDVTVDPIFTSTTTDRGRFWSVGGETQVTHYRPIQPRTSVGVSPPAGQTAHGALLTGLTSQDTAGVDPVFARPTVDLSAHEPEASLGNATFPAQFSALTSFATPVGLANRLVLLPGQFIANSVGTAGTQRLFTSMQARVLYSASSSYAPPILTNAAAAHGSDSVTFTVDATAQGGASISRVLVLFHTPGASTWTRLELNPPTTGSTFSATAPVTAGSVEWLAQAQDSFGNTATTTNKGDLFGAVSSFSSSTTGTAGQAGWFTSPVAVDASGPAAHYTVVVDGVALGPVPAVISAEGTHIVRVDGSDGSSNQLGTIKIDTLAPTAAFVTPANGTFLVGSAGAFTAVCSDGPVGSGLTFTSTCPGTGTVDTSKLGPASKAFTLTDVAGNSSTTGLTYRVQWAFTGFFSPVSNTTLNRANAGSTVPVKFSLQDATGYVGALSNVSTIDWQPITCPSGAPVSTVLATDATLSSLNYDATANQYVYTWKTPKALAGSCQRLTVVLADSTPHTALFQFT